MSPERSRLTVLTPLLLRTAPAIRVVQPGLVRFSEGEVMETREQKCRRLAAGWVKDLNLMFPVDQFIDLAFLERSVFELLMKV